jgi:hypothetical protein
MAVWIALSAARLSGIQTLSLLRAQFLLSITLVSRISVTSRRLTGRRLSPLMS